MKCPWCPWQGPAEEYSNHVDHNHSNLVPAGERSNEPTIEEIDELNFRLKRDERKEDTPLRSMGPQYLYAGPGYAPTDKEYHVKYMEKGTYNTKEVDLTARELTEFYQNKPYEQIIDVHKNPKK